MKKKIMTLIIAILLMLPIAVNAEEIKIDKYVTMNFEETLEAEGIEPVFSNYKENKNAAVIYMFRGHECGYCYKFLEFLNSIADEYGDKFILRSFEIWGDTNNNALFKKLGLITGQSATGVPFIMIGEQIFGGYASDWDEDIKEAIEKEAAAKQKYDYFEEYNKSQKQANGTSGSVIILAVIIADAITVLVVWLISNANKKEMMRHMTKIYRKLSNTDKKEEPKEETDDLEEQN